MILTLDDSFSNPPLAALTPKAGGGLRNIRYSAFNFLCYRSRLCKYIIFSYEEACGDGREDASCACKYLLNRSKQQSPNDRGRDRATKGWKERAFS